MLFLPNKTKLLDLPMTTWAALVATFNVGNRRVHSHKEQLISHVLATCFSKTLLSRPLKKSGCAVSSDKLTLLEFQAMNSGHLFSTNERHEVLPMAVFNVLDSQNM